jgi:Uma2 family endonuclease
VTADEFLRIDQSEFGNAWRYELVRGAIVSHAAPSPEHGIILSNLSSAIHSRLRDHSDCWSEIGSGAVAHYEQRDTARTPDATIRCGQHPRVLFEVVSPTELGHKRQWDRRRMDLQAVMGVKEIVEIFQDEMLVHVYRRQGAGADAELALPASGSAYPWRCCTSGSGRRKNSGWPFSP